MYTYELFEVNDGFGFNILRDGNSVISQIYQPDTGGFILMDEETAISYANVILLRMRGDEV